MPSANRWAIYCHFFGVAVNPHFFLPIFTTKGACFSANMRTFYCYFSSLNGMGNGLFWVSTGPGPHEVSGEQAKGHDKCALLYRCPTCIFARSARPPVRPHPNAADRLEEKMLSVCPPASSPPSKGCDPCAAKRLSQIDGRRPPIQGPATRPTALRASCLINATTKEETDDEENERRITERTDRRPAAA